MKVLFFGRKNCEFSTSAKNDLLALGVELETYESSSMGEKVPKEAMQWEGDFIFCFRSYIILPGSLISKARRKAVNFHPGPPEYPGSGCVNFALYDGAATYGVTAHEMSSDVDAGPILEVRRFPVSEKESIQSLLSKSHAEMYCLFRELTYELVIGSHEGGKTNKIRETKQSWQGKARRLSELEKLRLVDAGISKPELMRRIRAVHTAEFPLTFDLHGYSFVLGQGS
jgi:methionyl-tRNA formyltransferase